MKREDAEKWKTKDGSQPSKSYAVVMRVLGIVFALVGGMLIKWAVKKHNAH